MSRHYEVHTSKCGGPPQYVLRAQPSLGCCAACSGKSHGMGAYQTIMSPGPSSVRYPFHGADEQPGELPALEPVRGWRALHPGHLAMIAVAGLFVGAWVLGSD